MTRTALAKLEIPDGETRLLEGKVRLSQFEERGLTSERMSGFNQTFTFKNNNEGYLAQKIAGDNYQIIGRWHIGEEVPEEETFIPGYGRVAYNVKVVRQSPGERPLLRVVGDFPSTDERKKYSVA